jgi:hypothetical protein
VPTFLGKTRRKSIILSITNKIQRYTTFFIAVNALPLAVAASKLDIYQMLCVQFELLMMSGKTA